MIIYVFIVFIALCVGMAVSVYAFGTGGKRKRIFQDIYFSVEEADGIGVIYTKTGEYSAVLKLENPVQKYCANIDCWGIPRVRTYRLARQDSRYLLDHDDDWQQHPTPARSVRYRQSASSPSTAGTGGTDP